MENVMRLTQEMGYDCDRIELIREKDGVTVARLYSKEKCAILKTFAPGTSCREVENYRVLRSLGIPTLHVFAACDNGIIIEDMSSEKCPYRLAAENDMADISVARNLAQWYRRLHSAGFAHVAKHGKDMYSETSFFTRENIAAVRDKSGLSTLPVWKILDENYDAIMRLAASVPMTLTYNDFYYTNMAVARDGSAAMMFDYNLLGKGHVYSDVRNVEYSLSPEAAAAFREAYGERDFSLEAALDAVISPIVTLHFAYSRPGKFPDWAHQELQNLKTDYIGSVEKLISH